MADAAFPGSVVGFTPAGGGLVDLSPLVNFQYSGPAATVRVSGAADTSHKHVTGRKQETVTVDINGSPPSGIALKTKGATSVALGDGGDMGVFANCIITRISVQGRKDDKISSSISVRPCNA